MTPVVSGVVSLHNFLSRPLHNVARSAGVVPLDNLVPGGHAIAPYDFATIYDVLPLWNSGFDGTGQIIAIAGRTNINPNDIALFRSIYGLPANNPVIIVNGANPGIRASDETEADLDVEWSGAVAKGATIKFVVSASTGATDGADLSSQFIVDNNIASVMSVSFGKCEAVLGTMNQHISTLWSQAAAQGMSVFVAAGDSGSAGCDALVPASSGFGVNGIASTPYNVAVGGTGFNDTASPATWWNPFNDSHLASAKGYIPELVWNESGSLTFGDKNQSAGSGGVSTIYPTPSWQIGTGVPGVDPGTANQHHRYLPDVSLNAGGADHDGYEVCQEGLFNPVGGTSAASPSMAGIMAIINQYTGGRNGNPNPHLYALAAKVPSVYHDVTLGYNAVPCVGGSPGCNLPQPFLGLMTGYLAGPGYDLATGWGSVDAYALAVNWTLPGITNHFTVSAPASAGSGVPFNVSVTALDAFNNAVTSYSGTVHFTGTDSAATLPADATISGGTGTFSFVLRTTGIQTIAASDTGNSSIQGTSAGISVSANRSPGPTSANPASGSGTAQTITFTFADPDGQQDLDVVNILINNFLDGRSACYLAYSRPSNTIYLVGDDGGTLLPGVVLNGSGSVVNSQCSVNGAGSSVGGSGTTLTLALNMTFTPAFAGNKVIYMAARDSVQNNSGWQALGAWNVPGAATFPAAGGVTPARGLGSSQSFTFTFVDSKGFQDLGVQNILINNFLDGRQACYLAYSRPSNVLYLVNDPGSALLPGLVLNGAGSVANSQCTVTGAGSLAAGSGSTLTLTLNISFTASFSGNRVIYMASRDGTDANNSGWQSLGSWTVQ